MALNTNVIGKRIGPLTRSYTWKDVVLYALGVGAGFDELTYVYESQLKVLPSFSIASVFDFLAEVGVSSGADLSGILHGEQEIRFHGPIPPEGELSTSGAITKMIDKGEGKGALVVAEAETFHSDGQKLFSNTFTVFCRKDGGFGGAPAEDPGFELPDRPPDFEEPAEPSPDQPLIYRLSGDIFSLHVDPEFARASGFEKPIMHGLCTHGYACRAVIKHLFAGQPERMTRFAVRFSKTLYPGVPIKTQIWKVGEGRAQFRVLNAATDEVVIDRGVVEWMTAEEAARRAERPGIRFDGQVAAVTGAGAGLGRAYALELAARGAKVVVNDLGGAVDGGGGSSSVADAVVEEIRAAGGEAMASHDSVATAEGGQAIVDRAVETWGRLDILVNNAGILRDKSFTKLEPDAWRSVLAVHLDGAYNVTRPALKQMRKQKYGRVVLTSSAAGLFGNFGQVNYGAAKLALVGLMNSLKIEAGRFGVKVNTVAPIAGTRMTEGIIPPEYFERMTPERVAPLVVYLCSETCPVSGRVYDAGMGYFGRTALVSGHGAVVVGEGDTPATPEAVAAKIKPIEAIEGGQTYEHAMEALGQMLAAFNPRPEGEGADDDEGGGGGVGGVAEIFAQMPGAFVADAAAGVSVVFQFEISGEGGGQYSAVIEGGACEVSEGQHPSPTTTIIMEADDFVAMIGGALNPMQAYTTGKLKIEGDLMKSQLIEKLFSF